jgi:hypothetical protein
MNRTGISSMLLFAALCWVARRMGAPGPNAGREHVNRQDAAERQKSLVNSNPGGSKISSPAAGTSGRADRVYANR